MTCPSLTLQAATCLHPGQAETNSSSAPVQLCTTSKPLEQKARDCEISPNAQLVDTFSMDDCFWYDAMALFCIVACIAEADIRVPIIDSI